MQDSEFAHVVQTLGGEITSHDQASVVVDGAPITIHAIRDPNESYDGYRPQMITSVGFSVSLQVWNCPSPIILRHESLIDRLAKHATINREFQTGDDAFDAEVYLDTEADDATLQQLLGTEMARRNFLSLVKAGARIEVVPTSPSGKHPKVKCRFRSKRVLSSTFTGEILRTLVHLRNALDTPATLTGAPYRGEPFVAKETAPSQSKRFVDGARLKRMAISAGLLFALLYVPSFMFHIRYAADFGSVWNRASDLGAIIGLLLVTVPLIKGFLAVRGRSNSLKQMLYVVSMALSVVLICMVLMRFANRAFDGHPCKNVSAQLIGVDGKHTTYFHVEAKGYEGTADVSDISDELMTRYRNDIQACISPGAFGSPWITSITQR